jgi:hypothetical protein
MIMTMKTVATTIMNMAQTVTTDMTINTVTSMLSPCNS